MAVFTYKKYKISLDGESKKIQGLKVGDIVRRQYFDGENTVYSLMAVIAIGIDESIENGTNAKCPYFIGALIEGDVPETGQLLDFARITSLFDKERLGAIYMTASDENAPYIDIVDGIGKNKSLCWPESVATGSYTNPRRQYTPIVQTGSKLTYIEQSSEQSRLCRIAKNTSSNILIGIKQDIEEYLSAPDRVLVSYKIRGSQDITVKGVFGYSDWSRIDGEYSENITTEWQYCFHAISIDWSGRHSRAFQLSTNSLPIGGYIELADFNIILQSSLSNYQDASCGRIGKLDGIYDSVFGQLEGHGEYVKKIYASQAAHISGTLTAGDNNGFASTFYAGRIHKNVWINSISPTFNSVVQDINIINPTGMGKVYSVGNRFSVTAQTSEWIKQHQGIKYALSFWLYVKNECTLNITLNGKTISSVFIPGRRIESWRRYGCVLLVPNNINTNLIIGGNISFTGNPSLEQQTVLFASPQLEKGDEITQYQPTDNVLNETEDYGAWFNRGGIGGTIQNPLLKLNYDDEGSIGTSTNSFLLKNDGSGYLANRNIEWDENGRVVLGEDVTLSWGSVQDAPDWIYDWDSNKTLIGDEYVVTPKIFAGFKSNDGKLTGIYIGKLDDNKTGIYGYQNGDEIFHIDKNGGKIAGWVINKDRISTNDLAMSINSEGSIEAKDPQSNVLWGIYKNGEATFAKGNVLLKSDGSGAIARDKIVWNAQGDIEIKGKVQIGEGSSGWENMDGLHEKLEEITETAKDLIDGIGIGFDNLLFNTGFTGDYDSMELTPTLELTENSKTYSYQMKYWDGIGSVVEDELSASKFACKITSISQNVQTLIIGENYVISYKAKGSNIVVNCGNAAFSSELTEEYQKFSHKFTHTGGSVFALSGNATVCEIKLERGTIPTDWVPSSSDTDPTAAKFKNYWYLLNALQGSTQILNGLTLTSMIQLGEWSDGVMKKVNAGISGIYNDDMDVAHWAGGSFEQAIKTVQRIIKGDSPTEEEWKGLAKFVVTHGGDVIIRGYIYALGGVFRGTVYASDGVFRGTVYASDGEFKGKVIATSGEFRGTVYASDGEFKGKIIATSGEFKGKIIATSGEFRGTVYASDGEFRGKVIATSGEFRGTVYASEGMIGGFNISNNSISCNGLTSSFSIGVSGGRFFEINRYGATGTMCGIRSDGATALSISTYGNGGKGIYITANGDSKAIESYGNVELTARSEEMIKVKGLGLNVTYIDKDYSWIYSSYDFVLFNNSQQITVYFPSLNLESKYVGKIIYTKRINNNNVVFMARNLSPTIGVKGFRFADGSLGETYTLKDNWPRFWICDGEYWNEFICKS